ncbi:hypothetical protein chiPu_0014526 [Chiloscyllium punctatum]|uniref:Uncharacterized protein n=1 Tax=Chiloscyllium punctatum TaxID=137246 RepID=A0A401T083_CHIPU|nr:hypothetical protein [Chiloscyllium punctatum]
MGPGYSSCQDPPKTERERERRKLSVRSSQELKRGPSKYQSLTGEPRGTLGSTFVRYHALTLIGDAPVHFCLLLWTPWLLQF